MEYNMKHELDIILRKEDLVWYQRSHSKWLKDGDWNTKIYHSKSITRRRKNNVIMLKKEDGQWVEDVEHIRHGKLLLPKVVFRSNFTLWWLYTKVTYPTILNDDYISLNAPVDDEEVRYAIFNMHSWKSPRLTVFCWVFFKYLGILWRTRFVKVEQINWRLQEGWNLERVC